MIRRRAHGPVGFASGPAWDVTCRIRVPEETVRKYEGEPQVKQFLAHVAEHGRKLEDGWVAFSQACRL